MFPPRLAKSLSLPYSAFCFLWSETIVAFKLSLAKSPPPSRALGAPPPPPGWWGGIAVGGGGGGRRPAGGPAAAVDQHGGPLRAGAAGGNAGTPAGGCTGCGRNHAVAVALQRHSEALQELLDVGRAGGLDLLPGDDLHRKRGLGVDASDARAGDFDAFDGLLRKIG